MNKNLFFLLFCSVMFFSNAIAYAIGSNEYEIPKVIKKSMVFSKSGEFDKAKEILKSELNKGKIKQDIKRKIEWEIERLRRTEKDYSLTEKELYDELDSSLNNLTKEEFDKWIKNGYFDSLRINGVVKYVGASVSNLFFTKPEIRPRRKDTNYVINQTEFGKKILFHIREVKNKSKENKYPLVLPVNIIGDMTVAPKPEFVTDGKTIKCWLPVPSVFPQQSEVNIISSEPEFLWLSQPQSIIRSIYFEKKYEKEKSISFNIKYEYKSFSYYQEIDPLKIQPYKKHSEISIYLKEQPPNVVFLSKFYKLSKGIIKDESNSYLKAKKIYNWITENIYYSYAREYSTILNIPELTYDRMAGDCGMEALLFITLCRMNGVAARWQSGWEFMSGKTGMHDWAEIFIEPYGWIPVDPYMGIFAITGEHNLSQQEKTEIRDFYFGGLDHFRMVANKGHNMELYPPKSDFRSETVDFQRGELESDNKNLYFGEFKYKLELTEEKK